MSSAANIATTWPDKQVGAVLPWRSRRASAPSASVVADGSRLDEVGVTVYPGHRAVIPDEFRTVRPDHRRAGSQGAPDSRRRPPMSCCGRWDG